MMKRLKRLFKAIFHFFSKREEVSWQNWWMRHDEGMG